MPKMIENDVDSGDKIIEFGDGSEFRKYDSEGQDSEKIRFLGQLWGNGYGKQKRFLNVELQPHSQKRNKRDIMIRNVQCAEAKRIPAPRGRANLGQGNHGKEYTFVL